MAVAVGFDALLHGLSHGGHGLLDAAWRAERAQRTAPTPLLGSVGWHVVADVALGLLIGAAVAIVRPQGLVGALGTGLVLGGLAAGTWLHAWAAFAMSGRIAVTLAALAVAQAALAALAAGWVAGVRVQ